MDVKSQEHLLKNFFRVAYAVSFKYPYDLILQNLVTVFTSFNTAILGILIINKFIIENKAALTLNIFLS